MSLSSHCHPPTRLPPTGIGSTLFHVESTLPIREATNGFFSKKRKKKSKLCKYKEHTQWFAWVRLGFNPLSRISCQQQPFSQKGLRLDRTDTDKAARLNIKIPNIA